MDGEELSPLDQPGFGHLFDKLILRVNEGFGFHITREPVSDGCGHNDLAYDESNMVIIKLYACNGFQSYQSFEFQTSFIEDCAGKSLEAALVNLEAQLRLEMQKIKDWLNK